MSFFCTECSILRSGPRTKDDVCAKCVEKRGQRPQTDEAKGSDEFTGCIYRCGWCGYPVDKDGQPLSEIKDNDDANEYLRKNEGATTKNVNGFCCPNGDETAW